MPCHSQPWRSRKDKNCKPVHSTALGEGGGQSRPGGVIGRFQLSALDSSSELEEEKILFLTNGWEYHLVHKGALAALSFLPSWKLLNKEMIRFL